MIKQTFYNLTKEKRTRIINAVKKEFTNNPKEKVSINRIIKEANISRGSFYQYFDDKVDLIELLSSNFKQRIVNFGIDHLRAHDGNIFLVYEDMFDAIVSEINKDENKGFYKNILVHLKTNGNLFTDFLQHRCPNINGNKDTATTLDLYVNPKYLNCKTRDDIFHIITILNLVMVNSVFNIFVKQKSVAEERESFLTKMQLMRKGFETPAFF